MTYEIYEKILIATDGSKKSQVAEIFGLKLAKVVNAKVVGVYVVNEIIVAAAVRQLGYDKKEIEAKLQHAGEKAVYEIKKMAEEAGVAVETMIKSGAPANVIVDLARTEGVDLIVMGSHGESGVTKLLTGTVVQKVLYWATCPVLVCRSIGHMQKPYIRKILICTDGSAKCRVAVQHGVYLAKATGAKVVGVYVVNEIIVASAVRQLGADKKEIEAKLQHAGEKAVYEIKKMAEEAGVAVETMIKSGAPANVIVDLARTEGVDLIVMGSHGESGVTKLLIGSVVQKTLWWCIDNTLVVR